jgi:MoaA/NifB/PqqE/SkfB family radical SAM enzyme
MAGTDNRTLVIGRVPERLLAGPAGIAREAVVRADRPEGLADGPFRAVAFEGQWDWLRFLPFGERVSALVGLVAEGGSLVLFKRPRPRVRDDVFVFRTDAFFREEMPEAGRAAFERVEYAEREGWQMVVWRGRRSWDGTKAALAALPHDSLAWLPVVAGRAPRPRRIWMAATTRCNIRCRTCSVRYRAEPGSDMEGLVIERVFAEIGADVDAVNVTGIGEPIFSRHWPKLYAGIRAKPRRDLEIVSNGMLLTEDLVRDMMRPEHPTSLAISVDGATRETFESIRDRGKWDRLTQAMAMIRRVREEMQPGPDFRLAANFVAIRSNVHELPDFVRLAAEWGVDNLVIIDMGEWVGNEEYFRAEALRFHPRLANHWLALAREEAGRHRFQSVHIPPDFSDEVIALAESAGDGRERLSGRRAGRLFAVLSAAAARPAGQRLVRGAVRAVERMAFWPVPGAAWLRREVAASRYDGLGTFRRIKGYCSVVHERAYFHPDGDVAACCGLLSPVFGNILAQPFDDIWHGDAYREFRVMNLLGFPHPACFYCTLPYGLPSKNPANFAAAHKSHRTSHWLARGLRVARSVLDGARPDSG